MVLTIIDINGYRCIINGWKRVRQLYEGEYIDFVQYERVSKKGKENNWLEAMPEEQFWDTNPDGVTNVLDEDIEALLEKEGFKIGDKRIVAKYQRILKRD